ncbi:MAG: alpha/beta fold hydrolase [Burkholderiales bacterium]|nr:alpha/beta fold hydrolase [Burkholderiales bacterium]
MINSIASEVAASRRGWAEVNGVALRYELGGSGPSTLVLLHEMGGSIESWDGLVPLLPAGWRWLRYDQRGFGLSEKPTDITLDALVDDLVALLDALALTEPVVLVGAAVGAAIALDCALRHPQRVAALLLASPATGGVTPAQREAIESRIERVQAQGLRAVTDAMFQVTYPPALRVDGMATLENHRLRWLAMTPASFAAINRMLATFDLESELHRIACPTRVVGCRHDGVRPPARSAELAALIPGASYVETDSGHYLPVQSPALFAALLGEFLARF